VLGGDGRDNARVHPILLYAHRGAAAECPENTLPSFRRALEIGVDAIETDVHMTRDGVPVVSHDPSAERMTGVAVAWRDLDLADARRLDLGWGFVAADGSRPFAGTGVRLSTLEEVLVELPGVRFNVDIKQAEPSMVKPLLALLRRLRAEDRVTLASFRWRTLVDVRRRGYAGDTSLSQAEVAALLSAPRRSFRNLPFVGIAAQIPVRVGPLRLATRRFIDKCHAVGLRVDFWTINQPDEAERLLALGADGIMTDDPAAIAPVFARHRAAS
jgi:glycerophosphoryl diester phosphodiesterase